MARVRKKAVTVLVAAVVGCSVLITAGRMLELRRHARLGLEQQAAQAQDRVAGDVEARLAAHPAVPLADAARKLPLQFGDGFLLAYDNTGVLLTQTDPSGAPRATAAVMIGALQNGQETVSYENWNGRDWCVRGLPIRAGGSLAGTVVFMTDAGAVNGALGHAWGWMLFQTSATVTLATLVLLWIVAQFKPRLLTKGRFALVRVRSSRSHRSRTGKPAEPASALEAQTARKAIEKQA